MLWSHQQKLKPFILILAQLWAACGPSNVEDVLNTAERITTPAPQAERAIGTSRQELESYTNGSEWNCTVQQYSLTKSPESFVVFSPTSQASVIWPGNLLRGDSLGHGETPVPVTMKRGPGTIVLNLVNGSGGNYSQKLDEITQGDVVDAQNRILSGIRGKIPANFYIESTLVSSSEQLTSAINIKADLWILQTSDSLKLSNDKHYTRLLLTLTQPYFTINFQTPTEPRELFPPPPSYRDPSTPDPEDELLDNLKRQVSPTSPLTYISSVTYGRQFFLLFESSASAKALETSVQFVLNGGLANATLEAQAQYRKTQEETTVKTYALGGAADAALLAALNAQTGKFDKLQEYLTTGGDFDPSNPALPLSYVVNDARDNIPVRIALTSEYSKRQCYPIVKADGRLVLWLDARTLEAQGVKDQQYVSSWPGKTLVNNDGRNGRGLFFAQGINGRPSIWFEGVTARNTIPHRFEVDLGAGYAVNNDYTLLVVERTVGADLPVQPFSKGEANNYFIQGTGTTGNSNLLAGWSNPDHFYWDHYGSGMSPNARPGGQGDVLSLKFSQRNGKWAYQNGLFRAAALDQKTPLSSFNGASLGYSRGSWSPFTGHISEVRGYNYALSDAELKAVECELGAQWGIGVADCIDGKPDPAKGFF